MSRRGLTTPSARDQRPTRRWSRVDALAIALVAVPFVVAIVATFTAADTLRLVGDDAIIQLHVQDAAHRLLYVGPYSVETFSHPGPTLFYLLAAPYYLLGRSPAAIVTGALIINGAAAVGLPLIARRVCGRTGLWLGTLTALVLATRLETAFLRDPWNPYVTVLPYACFVVASWALANRVRWMVPVTLGLATFCVQSHIGYLPLVVPLLLGAVAAAMWPRGDSALHLNRRWMIPVAVGAGVLAVLWALPMFDELAVSHNLSEVVRYFTDGRPTRGLGVGLNVTARQLALRPDWIFGPGRTTLGTGEPLHIGRFDVPWLAIAVIVANLLSWRRQRHAERLLAGACAIVTGSAVIAVSRVIGSVFEYRLRVLWVVGVLAAVDLVVALLALARGRVAVERAARIATIGLAAVLAVVLTIDAAGREAPNAPRVTETLTLERGALRAVPSGPGVVVVGETSFTAGVYAGSIVLALERAGIPVRPVSAFPGFDRIFGRHRLIRPTDRVKARLTLAADGGIETLARRPDMTLVAYAGEVPRRERLRLLAEIRRELARADGDVRAPSVQRLVRRIGSRVHAVALFRSR